MVRTRNRSIDKDRVITLYNGHGVISENAMILDESSI